MDGSGAPARRADLLTIGDRIAELGIIDKAPEGCVRYDVTGLIVAPGFIDSHSHDDAILLEPTGSLAKLSQGVTSVVVGNCGIGLPPWTPSTRNTRPPPPLNLLGNADRYVFPTYASYFAALRNAAARPKTEGSPRSLTRGCVAHALVLAGHSTLRAARVADLRGPATPEELRSMLRDLEEGLDQGLTGLSAGLAYPAAIGAPASEIVALARAAFRRGRVFSLHIRNEYEGMWTALDEAFAIAREALGDSPPYGARLILSHQKCAGPSNRGRAEKLLTRIEVASREIPLAFDAYPYDAGSTLLEAESVRASRRVLVTWSDPHPELAGLDLLEAAERLGKSPEEAIGELSPAGAAYFHMDEADMEAILSHPLCMVGSDGLPNDASPHPRLYGAFPRYLARFVRESRRLSLEEAVRKITALPASVYGIRDRGLLVRGAIADITVFRPETVDSLSNWAHPREIAAGIALVFREGLRAYGAPIPENQGAGGR